MAAETITDYNQDMNKHSIIHQPINSPNCRNEGLNSCNTFIKQQQKLKEEIASAESKAHF